MKTELCDLLGIEYPIIQGGMAHISTAPLVGAVSEAGGLGVLATGFNQADWVRDQIKQIREITSKPFAVNLIMESYYVKDVAQVCVEEKVPVCTISAGKPDDIVPILVEAGIKTLVLIPHARAAKKMEALGATAVVAEGMEGGGHIGRMCTFPMVRQVAEAVNIPVIAAGGIADGKGFLAALALGAVGVQMGSVFLVADECPICDDYKNMILEATDSSTVLAGEYGRKQVRCIKNPFTEKFWEMHDAGASTEELEAFAQGSITRAAQGEVDNGAVSVGMAAGLINERKPAAQVIQDIMRQADEAYAELKRIYG